VAKEECEGEGKLCLIYVISTFATFLWNTAAAGIEGCLYSRFKCFYNMHVNRMKEVDWIPYLTTRLVDDAASHLRLFRQARAKMKQQRSRHKQQPSTDNRPCMSIAGTTELGKIMHGTEFLLQAVINIWLIKGFPQSSTLK
jgi:hypothetical protein